MQLAQSAGEVGVVALGGKQVYAYVERGSTAGGWRVRVGLDEFDGLGLHPFQWVRTRLPRRTEEALYFAGLREQPPFVWLDLRTDPPPG